MSNKPFPKYTYHLAGGKKSGRRAPGRFVSETYAKANPDLTVRVRSKCRQPSVKGVKRGRR